MSLLLLKTIWQSPRIAYTSLRQQVRPTAAIAAAAPTAEVTVASRCAHLDRVHQVVPRTPNGCEECLKADMWWVHLRLCLECGHVGCCDQSPGKHATKHFHQTHHPVIRSFEPGENWGWCYVDELMLEPAPEPHG